MEKSVKHTYTQRTAVDEDETRMRSRDRPSRSPEKFELVRSFLAAFLQTFWNSPQYSYLASGALITMSAIRIASRRASCSISTARSASLHRCAPVARAVPVARILASASGSSSVNTRRWMSKAAAAKDVTIGPDGKVVWPEPKLPPLTEKDKTRLKRQRNLGMYVGSTKS